MPKDGSFSILERENAARPCSPTAIVVTQVDYGHISWVCFSSFTSFCPFPLDKLAHQVPQSQHFSQRTAQNRCQRGQRQMPAGCHFFTPGQSGMPAAHFDSALFEPVSSESTFQPVLPQGQLQLPSVLPPLGCLKTSYSRPTGQIRTQSGQPGGDHPTRANPIGKRKMKRARKSLKGSVANRVGGSGMRVTVPSTLLRCTAITSCLSGRLLPNSNIGIQPCGWHHV